MTKKLKLTEIVTTAGTQTRAKINIDTVHSYAQEMRDGAKFPPVVVFHDGSKYILADGFHRVMASAENDFVDIQAEVNKGTKSDALKFALAVNAQHGLRRTNDDKRKSVELALAEWPKISDRKMAEICCVSYNFVGEVRKEQLSSNDSSTDSTRIGADGKTRKLPKKKSKSKPVPEVSAESPEPSPEEAAHIVTHEEPEYPATPRVEQAPEAADSIEAVVDTAFNDFVTSSDAILDEITGLGSIIDDIQPVNRSEASKRVRAISSICKTLLTQIG